MTYATNYEFNDKKGRLLLWDTTTDFNSSKGFLATNQHVDLRNFRSGGVRPVLLQEVEDKGPLTNIETVTLLTLEQTGILNDENWVKSGTGFTSMTVGPVAAKNNWPALTMATTGAAVATTLVSSMTEAIDISGMDFLSLILPDYNAFDGSSYVQLCSNASGDFSSNTSALVNFSANTAAMPHLKLTLSAFAAAGFDPSAVTGVKIVLNKAAAPSSGQACSILAIRAVKSTWVYNPVDVDTRLGALVCPVTLDGLAPGSTPIPLLRGQGDKDDPIPSDTALNIYFNAGGEAAVTATGTNYNELRLLFREVSVVADGTATRIIVSLRWNNAGTFCDTWRVDYTAPGPAVATPVQSVNLSTILTPASRYLFRAELVGTQINASLYTLDGNNSVTQTLWKHPSITNSDYIFRNGRVGLWFVPYDRDSYVDKFEAATTNYATLETAIYTQRTPVDAVQLAARFSGDMNLWQSYSGDVSVDNTKTISGLGSFRTELGITSNTFIVDDWTNTYLQFALWVPATVNPSNTPQVALISQANGSANKLVMPKLQPAQWNRLHFELSRFLGLITGTGYSLSISLASAPSTPLGPFWVDSTVIGRRRVRWMVRATPQGAYREFRNLVNDPNGVVHFKPDERGTALELRCDALTPDAWVAGFELLPHHAELGNPVYDRGYATR